MNYIDIHTHNTNRVESTLQIVCFSVLQPDLQIKDAPSSVGLHPWDTNNMNINELLSKLNTTASNENIVAIGECGLDLIRKTNYDQQKLAFKMQIEVAKLHQKPLILHCVRSYYECKSMLKNEKFEYPIIFHAFNGNIEEKNALLALNSYFSYGKNLFAENKKAIDTFVDLPIERIFIETDNSSIQISEIYNKASEIKGIEEKTMIELIEKNYNRIFKQNVER